MRAQLLILMAIVAFTLGAVDPSDPFRSASISAQPGASVPLDGTFTSAAGTPVTLRQLAAGKPLLIVPVQHECPNLCGVTLSGLAHAIDGQARFRPGRDFAIVALGIDPREGPAQASDDLARLAAQRPNAKWQPAAVTGGERTVRAVTDALGYRYAWSPALRQYAHLSATAVVTPAGTLSTWLYGLAPTAAQLDAAVTQAAQDRGGGVMEQIRLLCFHYDPRTGRYSLAITRVLRLAGLATVLLIAVGIALLARRRGAP